MLPEFQPEESGRIVKRSSGPQNASEDGLKTPTPRGWTLTATRTAREVAASDAAVMLRVSAIAAIGLLGNAEDMPLLSRYERSSDTRLRTASISAIGRIRNSAESKKF